VPQKKRKRKKKKGGFKAQAYMFTLNIINAGQYAQASLPKFNLLNGWNHQYIGILEKEVRVLLEYLCMPYLIGSFYVD